MQIMVVDEQSVAQKTVNLPANAIVKRDLTINRPFSIDKGLTESR